MPGHSASPGDFEYDPAQEVVFQNVASIAQSVKAAFQVHTSVHGTNDRLVANTPHNSPQGSSTNTPTAPLEWHPAHDEAFRYKGFDPDLLPTRQLVASCLRMCPTWTGRGMWDMPLPAID